MIAEDNIPKILQDIVNYLRGEKITFSRQLPDGRHNSSVNEKEIIEILKNEFNIIVPRKERAWWDFAIEDETGFYPVNIKITNTTRADNLNCKLGIYYALTGLIPDFPNETPWLPYFEKMKRNLGAQTDKDYYFLIFNKKNTKDVFINALKGLEKIQPNGNNLPFQCKWNDNRIYVKRTVEEAEKFILSALSESIQLRASIYDNFKHSFPNYV